MRKLGTVALVCVGLGMIGLALSLLRIQISFMVLGGDALSIVLGLFPPVAALLVGLYLIVNRNRYASMWFDEDPGDITLSLETVATAGVLLIGLWFLASSVGYLVNTIAGVFQSAMIDRLMGDVYGSEVVWTYATNVAGPLVEAAVGWLLVSRAHAISTWLLRRIPTRPPNESLMCPECGAPFDPDDYDAAASTARCTACGHELDPDAPNKRIQTDGAPLV